MFVDGGGWRHPSGPPPRKLPLTKRGETIIIWLMLVNAIVMLIAPIGGGTILQAVAALIAR